MHKTRPLRLKTSDSDDHIAVDDFLQVGTRPVLLAVEQHTPWRGRARSQPHGAGHTEDVAAQHSAG
jgi:hypothetical protein